jgi:hypothetical protein
MEFTSFRVFIGLASGYFVSFFVTECITLLVHTCTRAENDLPYILPLQSLVALLFTVVTAIPDTQAVDRLKDICPSNIILTSILFVLYQCTYWMYWVGRVSTQAENTPKKTTNRMILYFFLILYATWVNVFIVMTVATAAPDSLMGCEESHVPVRWILTLGILLCSGVYLAWDGMESVGGSPATWILYWIGTCLIATFMIIHVSFPQVNTPTFPVSYLEIGWLICCHLFIRCSDFRWIPSRYRCCATTVVSASMVVHKHELDIDDDETVADV